MSTYGSIFLVATPIGNLEDITLRALRVLKEVHTVYAEDTRNTRKLFHHYNIENKLDSFHSYNQKKKVHSIINSVKHGNDIAVVSDAGTPGISDPAYLLVKHAVKIGIDIIPVPGASALVSALIGSGLPTDRFYFQGFLPLKKGKQKTLKMLAEMPDSVVIYESIHRLLKSLQKIYEIMGDRYVCVARELTKLHESFYRGYLSDILQNAENIVLKGEVVIVIAGKNFKPIETEVM